MVYIGLILQGKRAREDKLTIGTEKGGRRENEENRFYQSDGNGAYDSARFIGARRWRTALSQRR